MRTKDPSVMERIKVFVESYYREHHDAPTIRAIAQATGIARTTVQRYLVAMDEQGMISYQGGRGAAAGSDEQAASCRIRTSLIDKCAKGYFSAPIVGSIRCGDPESEEEMVEEYVSLPESIFGRGRAYLLRASGDSMVDAGIDEGDLLVIRMQSEAQVGDLVVALDSEKQNTLKRYAGRTKEGKYRLEYMNRELYPDQVIDLDEFMVQGVVKHIIKSV